MRCIAFLFSAADEPPSSYNSIFSTDFPTDFRVKNCETYIASCSFCPTLFVHMALKVFYNKEGERNKEREREGEPAQSSGFTRVSCHEYLSFA